LIISILHNSRNTRLLSARYLNYITSNILTLISMKKIILSAMVLATMMVSCNTKEEQSVLPDESLLSNSEPSSFRITTELPIKITEFLNKNYPAYKLVRNDTVKDRMGNDLNRVFIEFNNQSVIIIFSPTFLPLRVDVLPLAKPQPVPTPQSTDTKSITQEELPRAIKDYLNTVANLGSYTFSGKVVLSTDKTVVKYIIELIASNNGILKLEFDKDGKNTLISVAGGSGTGGSVFVGGGASSPGR
jgi:hypothetical protein